MSRFIMIVLITTFAAVPALANPLMQSIVDLQDRVTKSEQQIGQLQAELAMARMQIEDLHEQIETMLAAEVDPKGDPLVEVPASDGARDTASPRKGDVWMIHVTGVGQADTTHLLHQLHQNQRDLADIRDKLALARRELTVLSKKETVITRADRRGYYDYTYDYDRVNKHSRSAYEHAVTNIRRLENREKRAVMMVKRVEQKIEKQKNILIITGLDESGTTAQITARNQAAIIAKTMRPWQWYQVTGPGREVTGTLQINMISAALTQAPQADTAPEASAAP